MFEQRIMREINLTLRRLRSLAAQAKRSGNLDGHRAMSSRVRELTRMVSVSDRDEEDISMFISYAKLAGGAYCEIAKSYAEEQGLVVRTGFDMEVRRDRSENIFRAVKNQISNSSLFLGIWSPEYDIHLESGEKRSGISPWMIGEVCLAAGMGKPFCLVIDAKIEDFFWNKIFPGRPQYLFKGDIEFQKICEEAIDDLNHKYYQSDEFLERMDIVDDGAIGWAE